MSYHELTADYPWLTKRMKHLISISSGQPSRFPSRHPLAFGLAMFVPRLGIPGAGGGLVSMLAVVAIVGVLAAVAIPNFVRFQSMAKLQEVRATRTQLQSAATDFIRTHDVMLSSLAQMGLPSDLSGAVVAGVAVESDHFAIQIAQGVEEIGGQQVFLTPYVENGALQWACESTLEGPLGASACQEGSAAPAASPAPGANALAGREEEVCDVGFREGAEFAALSSAQQAALRDHCNIWKLRQLE